MFLLLHGTAYSLLFFFFALGIFMVFRKAQIQVGPRTFSVKSQDIDSIRGTSEEEDAQEELSPQVKQHYDAFLVLDVEATCVSGSNFNWPNEIIEWPVILMKWSNRDANGRASELELVDEFRSFVKPIWRPTLSNFCIHLTGITQDQVDAAPTYPEVLKSFENFLAKHNLYDPVKKRRLQRFIWCTDGPFDIRDFVIKQIFLSNMVLPDWLSGDIMDVRRMVTTWAHWQAIQNNQKSRKPPPSWPKRPSLNITQQLRALSLQPFVGRQHSGIDDTRNIARIVQELARRHVRLEPNLAIHPGRRWPWMGRNGKVLEQYI